MATPVELCAYEIARPIDAVTRGGLQVLIAVELLH